MIPQHYEFSYQLYQESDDRIKVESEYVRGKFDINEDTSFRFQWLNDAISGASPTGALPGGTQDFLSDVDDVRTGILGALSRQFQEHRVELEISRSTEDDYTSTGFALTDSIELNQKNTTFAYGVNYLKDNVEVPILGDRRKESFDLFSGVTQIIDQKTIVSANLTIGYANGYLNDPYKIVQRDEVIQVPDGLGGFSELPVTNIYRENRPDSRLREVLQLEGRHYVDPLKGAADCVLRFSHDDYGVFSQTAQIEWRQEIGGQFQVIPFFRYYHQNEADFFTNTLNDVPIGTPPADPDGSGPNYSADYRLSSFDAISVGLRLRYQFLDHFTATAAYEHYSMSGSGDDTSPDEAYINAKMLTFGLSAEF
jgi:hypothetical protein